MGELSPLLIGLEVGGKNLCDKEVEMASGKEKENMFPRAFRRECGPVIQPNKYHARFPSYRTEYQTIRYCLIAHVCMFGYSCEGNAIPGRNCIIPI